MPVRPSPLQLRCPHCGWHTLWHVRSDALLAFEQPLQRCPQCGQEGVERRPVSAVTALLERLNPWSQRL